MPGPRLATHEWHNAGGIAINPASNVERDESGLCAEADDAIGADGLPPQVPCTHTIPIFPFFTCSL